MSNVQKLITKVEDRWSGATREERQEMIDKLRAAEGSLDEHDAATRTEIGALIDRIRQGMNQEGRESVTPEINTGQGYGFGANPNRFG